MLNSLTDQMVGTVDSVWIRVRLSRVLGFFPGSWAGRGICLVILPMAIFSSVAGSTGSAAANLDLALDTRPVMVDALGDTLPAGPYPKRIVSLSPSITEMLFALGVSPERIAGVTRYCDFPPEARARSTVGGIVDPSIEQLLARDPDLVLVTRGNPVPAISRMRELGLATFALEDRGGVEDVRLLMRRTLDATGSDDPEKARSMLDKFDTALSQYGAWSGSLDEKDRPGVYYADPENPEWTAGPGSHIDDLIRLAGGINIVQEGGSWPRFSAERLLMLQPDVLLLSLPDGGDRDELIRFVQGRPGWKNLRAVMEDRICWVEAGCLLRPGPRSTIALKALAACLHPAAHPGLPDGGLPEVEDR